MPKRPLNYQRLLVKREGSAVFVTLNRPEVRNALDELAFDELSACFRALAKDAGVRVAVLAGAGQDFCAGADIGWMRRASEHKRPQALRESRRLIEMCRAVDEAPFAVIARVHGNCFGGALGLVASSDVVFAAENARLRFSEVRLGLIPAVVSSFVLPKIGVGQARRLYLTAELLDAIEARHVGLVHHVLPEGELDAAIASTIKSIARNGPQAVKRSKAYIRELEGMSRPRRLAHSVGALTKVRATIEAKEGFSAFLEKRDPAWVKT